MDRRGFIKRSFFAMGSLAAIKLLENPLMAHDMDTVSADKTQTEMKRIMIIDGGPRRNMNTAQMLQKFA